MKKTFAPTCWMFLLLVCLFLLAIFSTANADDFGDSACQQRPKNWKKVLGKNRCKKKCKSNDDCRHAEKRCICDSNCGWSCIHRSARCPGLVDLPSGYVQSPLDYTVGSIATFGCYDGFTLLGSAERRCQGNRKWSGIQPQCQPNVKCGSPPEVANAYHSAQEEQTQFELETLIHYTCANGYYRPSSGLPKAKCLLYNGTATWFGPDLQCIARSCGNPGTLINGKQEGFNFQYTFSVKYSCVDGYELFGSPIRKCQADGTWSGREPHCKPVQCPKPFDPLHGKVLGTSLDYLARVTYSCDEGFRLVGQIPRACQADRTWSGQDPTCEEIRCPSLGPLENGYIQGTDASYGAIVMFYCVEGAHLSGSHFARCQKDGTWSSIPPKCLAPCTIPNVVNGQPRKTYGSGKVLHNNPLEIECTQKHQMEIPDYPKCENGRWSHEPKCVPNRCKDWPKNIRNGYVMFINTAHGSKAKYMCKSGYILIDGNETLTCDFGEWNGTVPKCKERECPHPNDVGIFLENGKIKLEGSMGTYEYKSYIRGIGEFRNIVFECDKGYVLKGPKRATCVNSTWEPRKIMHECLEQTHTPLEDTYWAIANTGTEDMKENRLRPKRFVYSDDDLDDRLLNEAPRAIIRRKTNISHSATFKPLKGKNSTRRFGRFSYMCPPLINDEKRHFSNIRHNADGRGWYPDSSQVMVQCQPGYELNDVENAHIVCLNGTWLPRPPVCAPKMCPLPQVPNAYFASQGEILNLAEFLYHGNGAKMYCMRGFMLEGNDVLECNRGVWLREAGLCKPKKCPVPYLRYGHYLVDALPINISHQSVLRFTCNDNFFPNPVNEKNPLFGEVYCNLGEILPHNPECNAEEGDPVLPPESAIGCRRPMDIEKAWIYRESGDFGQRSSAYLIDPFMAMYPNNTVVHYKCDNPVSNSDEPTTTTEASSVKCVNGDWFALLTPCADYDVPPPGVTSNNSRITDMQTNGHRTPCHSPNITADSTSVDSPRKDVYLQGAAVTVRCKFEPGKSWVLKCKRGEWKQLQEVHCPMSDVSQRLQLKTCVYDPVHYRHVYTFYEDQGEPLTFKENLPDGAVLTFRCNNVGLFQFMGSKRMVCQNGNWKGSMPHCRPLGIPWKEGQAPPIMYRATTGDLSLSNSGEIIARKSSTVEIDCVFPRSKATPKWDQTNNYRKYPQKWANATLHSWEVDDPDSSKDVELQVYRLTIYMARPEDSGVFFCVSPTGKRHSVKIRVIDIDCPPIMLNDLHIKYEATKTTTFGSMVHFICPGGYKLDGNVRIYCLEMGHWSNAVPTCNPIICPPFPTNVHHALLINVTNREYQSVATFKCAPGYTLQGPRILQCTESGKWKEPVPTCREVSCSIPDIPPGAKMQPKKKSYIYGEGVSFYCEPGYMRHGGKDYAVCADGGQWSNSPPDCQKFCRYPGKILNGDTTSEARDYYFVRDKVVYYCKSSQFKLIGRATLECTISGNWSGDLPVCRKRVRRHRIIKNS